MTKILCVRLKDETVGYLKERAKIDKIDVEVGLSLVIEKLVEMSLIAKGE